MKILFVCLGNICRSPAAEAVMHTLLLDKHLQHEIQVDSAGTGDWHVGQLPDSRMRQHCEARGYPMGMRARQFVKADFKLFDVIIVMDLSNYKNVAKLAPTPGHESKIKMMCSYATKTSLEEVPDPYYGGPDGFTLVIDVLEDACAGLLESLQGRIPG